MLADLSPHSSSSRSRTANRAFGNRRGVCGLFLVATFLVGSNASAGRAQSPPDKLAALPSLHDVQLGFKPLPAGARTPTHKVGLWAPLSVRLASGGSERQLATPAPVALVVHSEDSEDHATLLRRPIAERDRDRTLVTFIKPGRKVGDLHVALEADASGSGAPRRELGPPLPPSTADLNSYLYLCLGSKLDDLPEALLAKEIRARDEGILRNFVPSRFAVHEDDPARLPDRWIGYDSIDLAILCTGNRVFLQGLLAENRAVPLLEWVAGGGRLVVSLHPANLDLVQRILTVAGPPAVPIVPAPGDAYRAKSLVPIEVWAGLRDKPFPARGQPEVAVVRLDRGKASAGAWDIQAQITDRAGGDLPVPLLARMAYGFGSITYVAFPLDEGPFTTWAGRGEFLRNLADQFGPRYLPPEKKEQTWRVDATAPDLGTQLHLSLDNFDVPMVPFGYVALFILLYILLVGPLDYFVLRRLFGRLEWTWFTFPLIVVGVSLVVYSVLASERNDLLINRINLLDFDLRTGAVAAASESPRTHAQSFFAVRSPRIRSHTIAMHEEVPDASAIVSWFGRPDPGPAGMGRAGSQSVSRKSYTFRPDLHALEGVPFADRGIKAFVVEWNRQTQSAERGLKADLIYHPREATYKVTGSISNGLASDLEEVSLFIFDRVYRLEGGLPRGQTRSIAIKEIDNGILPGEWKDKSDSARPTTAQGPYDPATPLRFLMFHERLDSQLQRSNHALRRLDWSWRLRDDPRVVNVSITSLGIREAILVARIPHALGDGDARPAGFPNLPLPIKLDSQTPVKLAEETYVRAILPLRPQP